MRWALSAALIITIVVPIVFDVLTARDLWIRMAGSVRHSPRGGGTTTGGVGAISETTAGQLIGRTRLMWLFGSAFAVGQFLAFAELLKRVHRRSERASVLLPQPAVASADSADRPTRS